MRLGQSQRVGIFGWGSERALPYLLLAPTIAVLLALSIYPLFYAVTVSLQTGAGARARARWTLANFTRLASDSFFLDALTHTFIYATVALTWISPGWGLPCA